MQRTLMTAAALAIATCLVAQDPTPPKPPADPAPAPAAKEAKAIGIGEMLPKGISCRTIDGKMQSLDDLRGKVVVFHFWSKTCPSEKLAEPKLNTLTTEFADKGVVVLGIAANGGEIGEAPEAAAFDAKDEGERPYADLRKKAKASNVNHPILVDHGAKIGKLLDAKTTPHCFVFDKEGKLQYTGALDSDGTKVEATPYLKDAITSVLAGEKPAMQTSKPYG
ncbi:MAG TPA: redoxin domain-containing protein [Planctomycetota bacterium]|nr:redoxin domain-containing protein [Planctomycetota bacterium]